MLAALFVDPAGVYSGRPDVDVWGPDRDARTYRGPWPVVAHPPCATWGAYARRYRRDQLGNDGGCFAAALRAVRAFRGVIEHPASSSAWTAYGLPRPGGWGWRSGSVTPAGVEWVCAVDQGHYGHPAPKRTWLYLVTPHGPPPPLRWDPSGVLGRVAQLRRRDREATPPEFARLLLGLVTSDQDLAPAGDPSSRVDRCAVCAATLVRARYGPRRSLCSDRCRQRASRAARVVSRVRVLEVPAPSLAPVDDVDQLGIPFGRGGGR